MNSPGVWALIWIGAAAVFGIGEMMFAGSFFLLPFAIGALVAAIISAFGAPILLSWVVFIVLALVSFFALKPLSRQLDQSLPNPTGIGANRLVGSLGSVAADIPVGSAGTGMVRIGGEEWRAEGRDGMGLTLGTEVRIVEVRGTRVVVEPAAADNLGPIA